MGFGNLDRSTKKKKQNDFEEVVEEYVEDDIEGLEKASTRNPEPLNTKKMAQQREQEEESKRVLKAK